MCYTPCGIGWSTQLTSGVPHSLHIQGRSNVPPKDTPWTATQCTCGGHIGSGFDQVAHTVLLVVQVAHTVLLVVQVSGQLFMCCSSTSVVVGIAEIYCNTITHCQELCPQQFCLDGGCGSDDKQQSATSRRYQVSEGSVQPIVLQYLIRSV